MKIGNLEDQIDEVTIVAHVVKDPDGTYKGEIKVNGLFKGTTVLTTEFTSPDFATEDEALAALHEVRLAIDIQSAKRGTPTGTA